MILIFLLSWFFSWDQKLKKVKKKSKMCYVFAIPISPAFCLLLIRVQSWYIFNQNSKILIFGRLRAKKCNNLCWFWYNYKKKKNNFTNLLPSSINYIKTKISGIGYLSIRIIWPWSFDQGKGYRGQPNCQNEHILRIFVNSD